MNQAESLAFFHRHQLAQTAALEVIKLAVDAKHAANLYVLSTPATHATTKQAKAIAYGKQAAAIQRRDDQLAELLNLIV